MTIQPYNFARPAAMAGAPERALERWLRTACALAPRKWDRQAAFRVEMGLRGLEVTRREEALACLPDAAVCHCVSLATGAVPALLTLPRPLVLALVGGLLGDTEGQLPADRELTAVEESLYEYLLQEFLLPTLQETWPGPAQQPVALGPREPQPKWTRFLPPDEALLVASLGFTGPFGEQQGYWLLACKPLLALIAPASKEGPKQGPNPRTLLEAHVRELAVPVSVALGSVELPLARIGRLQKGDVVVLDQRIEDTLPASVAGKALFRVWCGRVGSQQAVQVESLLGD